MITLKWRVFPGEVDCGDQMACWEEDEGLICCVVDGLGHGSHAKNASDKIVDFVGLHRSQPPEILFSTCDQAMQRERGGVMAVAWIAGDQLTYASVGNITGYLVQVDTASGAHRVRQLHMDRGMIGGGFKTLNVQRLKVTKGDLVIMHSDGVNPVYSLDPWQMLLDDSERLATMLLEDQGKETDDACVLVYQHKGACL